MSCELKQFESLTLPIFGSPGSANSMSTHFLGLVSKRTLLGGGEGGGTYGKERGAVDGELDDLDGGVVAGLDGRVDGQGHLREADGARVGVLAGAEDLEDGDHGEGHVDGTAVGAVGAEAHVDVHEGCRVALEPARLPGEGAACCRPVGSVLGHAHAAACEILCQLRRDREERMGEKRTWVVPLHAVGPCLVGDEVVAAPAWV